MSKRALENATQPMAKRVRLNEDALNEEDASSEIPTKFKNAKDQFQFEAIWQALFDVNEYLPGDILNEIAYDSVGKCDICACKKCATRICILEEDIEAYEKKLAEFQTDIGFPVFNRAKFFCSACKDYGPVVHFPCCGAKCFHGDAKQRCIFAEYNDNMCYDETDEQTERYCFSFRCTCELEKNYTGFTKCCGNYVCAIHAPGYREINCLCEECDTEDNSDDDVLILGEFDDILFNNNNV